MKSHGRMMETDQTGRNALQSILDSTSSSSDFAARKVMVVSCFDEVVCGPVLVLESIAVLRDIDDAFPLGIATLMYGEQAVKLKLDMA